MTVSYSDSFIVPEVYAASIRSELLGRLVLRPFAHTIDSLVGGPGDTINLTDFSRLSNLSADVDEEVALVPEAITSSATPLTLVEAGKAVEVSWRASKTSFGSPVDQAISETARVIATRVDDALRAAAEAAATATGNIHPVTGPITFADDVAGLEPFGDAIANGNVSLVVHSHQLRTLLTNTDFQKALGTGQGGPGFVGILGSVVPVYVSDRITSIVDPEEVDPEPTVYRALAFYGKPLAYADTGGVEVHKDDDILARTTVVSATLLYTVGAMDAAGIAVIETQ